MKVKLRPATLRLLWSGLLPFAALTTGGCGAVLVMFHGGLQPPTLTFQSTKVTAASPEGATLSAVFRVDNPNPIPLRFGGASLSCSVESKKLFSADVPPGAELASGSSTLELPVRFVFAAIADFEALTAHRDDLEYSVESTVTLRSQAGDQGLPLKWSGTLPVPHPPRLEFGGLHVEQLSFGIARVTLSLVFDNSNAYAESFESLSGRLMFADAVISTIAAQAPQPLAARGRTEVRVPLELATAGTTLSEALQVPASVFRFEGSARVDGKDLPVDGTAGLK